MSCINATDPNRVNNVILASACKAKLARWKEGLDGFAHMFRVGSLDLLVNELVRLKPEVLLLDHDLPGLNGMSGVYDLRKLCPETKIVVLKGSTSEEEEWTMFKAGVRGCCPYNIDPSSMKTLVEAVQKGELWIRRTLIHRLLGQLQEQSGGNGKAPDIASLSLLENLTQREYEIAIRVGAGENNKQVAHSLNITDRTVKAHLTEVFRKLGVTDRLKVAIILSGEKRKTRRTPQKG